MKCSYCRKGISKSGQFVAYQGKVYHGPCYTKVSGRSTDHIRVRVPGHVRRMKNPSIGPQSSPFRRIKRITSHTGFGIYLDEALTGDVIGEIPRTSIPSPYAYSPTHNVYLTKDGRKVIIVETKHKQYDVFEIPKGTPLMPVEKNPSAREMHEEELKGAGEYLHMAQKVRQRGYPSIARGFEGMAKDEARHAGYIDVARGVGAIKNPKRGPNRFSYLHDDAHAAGMCVATYSPGDGVTRYRFFTSTDGKCVNYFEGTRLEPYGRYTALGLHQAELYIKNVKAMKVVKNPKKKPWSQPSDAPKPEFKLGDKVSILGTGWTGTISFIGEYDSYVGSYRYKVLETDGTRKWWHGSALQRIGEAQQSPVPSKLNFAENALRDMFLQFKGRVKASDIQVVLTSKRWAGMYGKSNVQNAWRGLVKDKFVVRKGNMWEWPIMIEMGVGPQQNPYGLARGVGTTKCYRCGYEGELQETVSVTGKRILVCGECIRPSEVKQNPTTPYPKRNMVRLHGWKIYMMDDRVTVEHTKSGFIDYPTYRTGGHLSWNYPERVPRYIKGAVVDYFQELNKEETYYEPNGILSWVKSKIIKPKEQPAAPVAVKNPQATIWVKLLSHRAREYFERLLGKRQSYASFRRDSGAGVYKVTPSELERIKTSSRIKFMVVPAVGKDGDKWEETWGMSALKNNPMTPLLYISKTGGKYSVIYKEQPVMADSTLERAMKVLQDQVDKTRLLYPTIYWDGDVGKFKPMVKLGRGHQQNPTIYHIQKERQILGDLKSGDMTQEDLIKSTGAMSDERGAFSRVLSRMVQAGKIHTKSIGKGLPTYYSLYSGSIPGAVIAKKNPRRKSDYLRDLEHPTVLGHELDRRTLAPVKRYVDTKTKKDYGADPLGDNKYRMVPSGDIVDFAERTRRLQTSKHWTGYKKNPALPGQCPLDDTEITYDNDDGHIVHPTRKEDGTDIYTGGCKRGCKIEFRYGRWGGELRIDGKPV